MSFMDPSYSSMGDNKEQFELLYGKMDNEDSYNLQNPSILSNDHTLNDYMNSYMNSYYSENSNLQSPDYDPISRTNSPVSPHDRLVPNMQTPDYNYSYNTPSPMGSSSSPSSSPMNTAQLVTAVYGEASDQKNPQERVPIVWHFLLRLLADPQSNPSIICWDNIDQHTFRLINPDAVASRWGERLGKPNLTRNNFARTLRYHYSNGDLTQMSEQQIPSPYYETISRTEDSTVSSHDRLVPSIYYREHPTLQIPSPYYETISRTEDSTAGSHDRLVANIQTLAYIVKNFLLCLFIIEKLTNYLFNV